MDSYYLNDAVENLNAFLHQGGQPEVDRRDRLRAARPALLGPERAELMTKMINADRQIRAAGRGSQGVAILTWL